MSSKTLSNKISSKMYGSGRGWAFSPNDFLPLGSADAVRQTLSRLRQKGVIRSVCRGIYDYPRQSKLLGTCLPPDLNQVAHALARKHGWRIQVSGNAALNLLGLSTQVPAQFVYLSDGPSKTYAIGTQKLKFKKNPLKEAGFAHHESDLVVQALKELGPDGLDDAMRARLIQAVLASQWPRMVKDTLGAPAWVHEIIRRCAQEAKP